MSLNIADYPTLALANLPDELRSLPQDRLPALCAELRSYLLHSVSSSSGHLASGLGVIELTVALHYVYHTPFDRLVWDVGHQAYPHKILTGRRDLLPSIRQLQGLHPFPWREESEYDTLSVGHSSTSISAALGMAIAADQEQQGRKVAAIIGDGALTAGMAFEALNHAGDIHKDLLVILNDNEMSISENVGALNNHLARIMSGSLYSTLREGGKKALEILPPLKALAKRTEEHLKGMVIPGTLFEEFGFNYVGPIDGHDINALVETLRNMRKLKGSQFLHIITRKGKGYLPAEKDPIGYHGVPKFDPSHDSLPQAVVTSPSYSKVFGDWLCDMATLNPHLMAITPAMREGSGLVRFSREFPKRYFDVAIAEQHAITLAAGMAIEGKKPVVAIYSTFLQRGYDQLIHDVALQNLDVLFAIDRAGIVGADGPTHQGAYDLSFMRTIPNMLIMTPADENECRQMLYTGFQHPGPAAVRYPRGTGPGQAIAQPMNALEIGKGRVIRQASKANSEDKHAVHSKGIALLNFGSLLAEAKLAAKQLDATLVDMRFVKPLDEALLLSLVDEHDLLVTIEENAIMGGAGSAVNECLMRNKKLVNVLNIGLPDYFIEQGGQQQILAKLGLDATGMVQSIQEFQAR